MGRRGRIIIEKLSLTSYRKTRKEINTNDSKAIKCSKIQSFVCYFASGLHFFLEEKIVARILIEKNQKQLNFLQDLYS